MMRTRCHSKGRQFQANFVMILRELTLQQSKEILHIFPKAQKLQHNGTQFINQLWMPISVSEGFGRACNEDNIHVNLSIFSGMRSFPILQAKKWKAFLSFPFIQNWIAILSSSFPVPQLFFLPHSCSRYTHLNFKNAKMTFHFSKSRAKAVKIVNQTTSW